MKVHIVIFTLAFSCMGLQPVFSQFGLRLTNLEHVGRYGEVFKPALMPEVSYYVSDIDDDYIVGVGIGYTRLQTRRDTFFNYTVEVSGTTTILPSYEIYEQIKYLPITFYYAYKFFDGPLRPILGGSLNGNILYFNYTNRISTLIDSYSINESLNSIGFMPFFGGSYQLNDQFLFQFEVGHQFAFDSGKRWNRQWRTSLAAIYYLY